MRALGAHNIYSLTKKEYNMSIVKVNRRINPFGATTLNGLPTLFPYEIFEEMDKFLSGMDLFNPTTRNLSITKGFPKGDLYLEGSNLVIELALAGYSKDKLSVTIDEDCLVVAAEKLGSDAAAHKFLARRAFRKVFPQFGSNWALDQAEVTYNDGLLRVVVPPVEPVKKEVKTLDIK